MSDDIVMMSSKGQLVVPEEIREQAGSDPSDRFIAVPVDDGVLFKKIEFDVREEYEN
jgi:bifunctional DNA-binding transcriptional regulator/antitoxin component of YhaV-PrlF toxin-antitoxin module